LEGGYPELYEKKLEENEKIRIQIKKRVEDGMPLYAECGGLMYALEKMDGYEMLGLFKGTSKLTKKKTKRSDMWKQKSSATALPHQKVQR
jgi:cobyrinic acid a,c-diamide synthase